MNSIIGRCIKTVSSARKGKLMPHAETAIITGSEGSNNFLQRLTEKAKTFPAKGHSVYKAENIRDNGLPVRLAGYEFILPIKMAGESKFAWLDPSGRIEEGADPRLMQACAVEVGVRLVEKMKDTKRAVLIEPPTGKSKEMSELGAHIAAKLTEGNILVVQAGGGTVDEFKEFFPEDACGYLRSIKLEVGQKTETIKARTFEGEEVFVVRYKPVTGKDKFIFLTATQYAQINMALQTGAVLATIEDVVANGTTVGAERALLRAGGVSNPLEVIAVAREGESYKGQMDYAIQIPAL